MKTSKGMKISIASMKKVKMTILITFLSILRKLLKMLPMLLKMLLTLLKMQLMLLQNQLKNSLMMKIKTKSMVKTMLFLMLQFLC